MDATLQSQSPRSSRIGINGRIAVHVTTKEKFRMFRESLVPSVEEEGDQLEA